MLDNILQHGKRQSNIAAALNKHSTNYCCNLFGSFADMAYICKAKNSL